MSLFKGEDCFANWHKDKWRRREKTEMKKLIAVLLALILVSGMTGCQNVSTDNNKTIYIPVLGDAEWLHDDGAFYSGVQLAVEDCAKEYSSLGYNIKTSIIDDKASYDDGVAMAVKLGDDPQVTAVLNVQNFDVSKTTADILSSRNKVVLLPYGAYDELCTKSYKNVFCNIPSFADIGKAMALYAVKMGYRRIAVYHNGTSSQEELITAFELNLKNTKSKIIDYVPDISSQSNFDNIYKRWEALSFDSVIIAQYGLERAYEVLGLIRGRDSKIPIIGEPIFNRANYLSTHKKDAENIVVPSTLIINSGDKLNKFMKHYKEKYGKEADIWSVQGYDSVRLIVDTAVKNGTVSSEKIAKALHGEKGYEGIQGKISFDSGGALKVDAKKINMLICKNGSFTKVKK